jgi:hypothetical protein
LSRASVASAPLRASSSARSASATTGMSAVLIETISVRS